MSCDPWGGILNKVMWLPLQNIIAPRLQLETWLPKIISTGSVSVALTWFWKCCSHYMKRFVFIYPVSDIKGREFRLELQNTDRDRLFYGGISSLEERTGLKRWNNTQQWPVARDLRTQSCPLFFSFSCNHRGQLAGSSVDATFIHVENPVRREVVLFKYST